MRIAFIALVLAAVTQAVELEYRPPTSVRPVSVDEDDFDMVGLAAPPSVRPVSVDEDDFDMVGLAAPPSVRPVSVDEEDFDMVGLPAPVVASKGAPIVRTSGHSNRVA